MKTLFEERSSYAPATDSVAVVSLTVECNPGQVEHVLEFLAQVRDRAGVYSVDFDTDVRIPETKLREVPKADVFECVTTPLVSVSGAALDFAVGETEGEVHGEQAIQQPSDDAQAAEVGPGTADVGGDGESEPVSDGVAPVVAEPSGEVGTGSVERSP